MTAPYDCPVIKQRLELELMRAKENAKTTKQRRWYLGVSEGIRVGIELVGGTATTTTEYHDKEWSHGFMTGVLIVQRTVREMGR
jgi:hypothetical protein